MSIFKTILQIGQITQLQVAETQQRSKQSDILSFNFVWVKKGLQPPQDLEMLTL